MFADTGRWGQNAVLRSGSACFGFFFFSGWADFCTLEISSSCCGSRAIQASRTLTSAVREIKFSTLKLLGVSKKTTKNNLVEVGNIFLISKTMLIFRISSR
jgi:hypothetical protein